MTKRDLAADLKICEAATHGPWEVEGDWAVDNGELEITDLARSIRYGCVKPHRTRESAVLDAKFIAAAREGWPEAIERAMAAESEVERLRGELEQERCKAESFFVGLKDAQECEQAMFVLADKWHNEAERLRQQLVESEAGAAAMREALTLWMQATNMDYELWQNWRTDRVWRDAYVALGNALSSTAGAVMLERLRKLEAVVETAKSILARVSPECRRCLNYGDCNEDDKISSKCSIYKLKNALAALEGGQTND